MPLVSIRPVLEAAYRGGYAQGAFNANSGAQIKALVEAHELMRSPLILQAAELANGFLGGKTDFSSSTIDDKRTGAKNIVAAARTYGENSPIPIVLHLDHGRSFESVKAAVDAGYTSVMIDGSALQFSENLELTREVVKYAHTHGVSVEGELGVLAGVEDDVSAHSSTYTDPVMAVDFIEKTEVDCLAISYGTMHGAVKGENVKLRKGIAVAINECLLHRGIFCALVSHGSSLVPEYIVDTINKLGGDVRNANGIPLEELKEAIRAGITKINIDTDIRLAVTRNLRELFIEKKYLAENAAVKQIKEIIMQNPAQYDPRVLLTPIMDTLIYGTVTDKDVAEVVRQIERGTKEIAYTLIGAFGSVGKADVVNCGRQGI